MKTNNICPYCEGVCDKRGKREVLEELRDERHNVPPTGKRRIVQRYHPKCREKSASVRVAANKALRQAVCNILNAHLK